MKNYKIVSSLAVLVLLSLAAAFAASGSKTDAAKGEKSCCACSCCGADCKCGDCCKCGKDACENCQCGGDCCGADCKCGPTASAAIAANAVRMPAKTASAAAIAVRKNDDLC